MKTFIKKSIMAIVCLVAFQTTAMADNDKPINVNQLPATAQQVIKGSVQRNEGCAGQGGERTDRQELRRDIHHRRED